MSPLGNTIFAKSNRATARASDGSHLSSLTPATTVSLSVTNPAANVLDSERYVVAAFPTPLSGNEVIIEVDLGGGGQTVDMLGLLNVLNPLDGATHTGVNPQTCTVWADVSTPVAENVNTQVASLNFATNGFNVRKTPRDLITTIVPLTKRYWRFHLLNCFDGLIVGTVLLGRMQDMGRAYSPGSSEDPVHQKIRAKSVMGAEVATTVGPNRVHVVLQWNSITRAMLDNLLFMFTLSPVPVITPTGDGMELDINTDSLRTSIVWGTPELWNVTVEGDSLA
jgi:hypothetical protein